MDVHRIVQWYWSQVRFRSPLSSSADNDTPYSYFILLLLRWMSSSYGTAKSGVGISAMSVLRPDLMMKCVVPVIMAGIIAVSWLSSYPQLAYGTRPYSHLAHIKK